MADAAHIPPPPAEELRHYGRRTFLTVVAGGVSSLVWGGPVWNVAKEVLLPVAGVLPGPVANLVRRGWRIYTVTSMPHFDPATWRLRIDGLVDKPLELTYADLRALPRVDQVNDFHCVTGWSVPHVHWTGVRLGDLIARAQPQPAAQAVGFFSGDGVYSDSLTLEQATVKDVIVAYDLGGAPLSRPHGAPARIIIPEMFGYKGVKWVNHITLLDQTFSGYWEERGYDTDAYIKA